MKLTGNTILITGGATGIGLALAERFLEHGNTVIICGRRESALKEAQERLPALHIRKCDVAQAVEREALAQQIIRDFSDLSVLVNNAGIQQRMNLTKESVSWSYYHQEIAANIEAPIHLAMLFLPHLLCKSEAAIVNVSSGLAFTPMAAAPIYSATKAAIHSFTMSLRHQLSDTNVEVIEVVPPAVNTDIGGKGLHTFGADVNEYADGVFHGLEQVLSEIGYGTSEKAMRMSREEIDAAVAAINSRVRFQDV